MLFRSLLMSLPEVPRTASRVVPIVGTTQGPQTLALPQPRPTPAPLPASGLLDRLGRPLRDLRISVTDRCNFRCGYCMPRESFGKDHPFLPHQDLLNFEEVTRVARVMAGLGVRKLRLTGGEPLLRKGLEVLVAQLAALRTDQGLPMQIAMKIGRAHV